MPCEWFRLTVRSLDSLQVLRPCRLAALAGIAGPPQQPLHRQLLPPAAAAEADAMRLARYALRRCDAVCSLLHRLATVGGFACSRRLGL